MSFRINDQLSKVQIRARDGKGTERHIFYAKNVFVQSLDFWSKFRC